MRYLILLSIFGTCSKTIPPAQLKLYLGDSLVNGHWSQLVGPAKIIFDHPDSSVVTISYDNPQLGIYVIQAKYKDSVATSIITVTKKK